MTDTPGAARPDREPRDRRRADESPTDQPGGGGPPRESPFAPSADEVEAWAERERQRRQAWLNGPSDEEKRDWYLRERERRLMQAESAYGPPRRSAAPPWQEPPDERRALQQRYARDAQLATEGLGLWLTTWPFRVLAGLTSAGREWEEDYLPPRRRRVPLYDYEDDY